MASKKVVIDGDSKYPLVPINAITLAERPEEGEESTKLFFNPRSLDSFDTEAMTRLRESIQQDGLQQPPVVRIFTKNGKKDGPIELIELVAGERRFRSMSFLHDNDSPCYDEDTEKTVGGKKLYAKIPCKVLYNISDEQALRIAFKENNEHKSLSIQEEIHLVERLTVMGKRQEEISDLLGTNVTWVSQTANFREELPDDAFKRLVSGQLTRHVAVQILSFDPAHRSKLFKEAVKVEESERKAALEEIQDELDLAEDEEDIAITEQEEAATNGDVAAAKKAKKKITAAKKKAEKAKKKKEKVENGEGVIKQGHISEGGRQANVAPKKAKMLNRPATQEFFVDIAEQWLERGKTDDESGEELPSIVVRAAKATAEAILTSNTDLASVLRNVMIEEGIWADPEL